MSEVKKDWQSMSKAERMEFSAQKKAEAKSLVGEGSFPPALRITIGGKDYLATPSGVSEKGSVAYSLGPLTIDLKGRAARINKLNISVLNTGETTFEEIDMSQVL